MEHGSIKTMGMVKHHFTIMQSDIMLEKDSKEYEMTMLENRIRVVVREESQINSDATNMTLIDAETGNRYEHYSHLNDETVEV